MENTEWKPDESLRRIVCAACWFSYPDGHPDVLVLGPRHWDNTMRSQYENQEIEIPYSLFKQGFIDNFGKLHSREDALVIARRMNQVVRELDYDTDKLYSEMLY
jgi:hypothetical protein